MSDSDEEKVLLHDESMDEVHELEDALQESVDTAASSPMKRRLRGDSSSSDGSVGGDSSSDSSSEDESFLGRPGTRNGGASMSEFESVGHARAEESSDEDSDEPPEIPGSPIAQKLQAGVVSAADFGAIRTSAKFSPDRSDMKGSLGDDEDEYEVKEVEQSRAAEFHASSSSEDEDESDGDNRRNFQERTKFQLQMERSALGRPKTAAKDLEKYRDVVPNDFFQQFEGATAFDGAESPLSGFANTPSSRTDSTSKSSARALGSAARDESNLRKYKVAVPREVEELFSLADAYTPEDVEIETRLEPFLPEFTPAVGMPFDGILIPRPDGKEDKLGVEILREPSGQTNVAELELLMQVSTSHQRKLRSRNEVVRSIEWAAQRPQEVDQWIASVEKVQRTKPLAEVNYKQAMPPLSQLMELWPEEFEDFLAARGSTLPALSELDVKLKELVKIVCAVLDIPVYEGNCVQSLHVLFSLYLEIQAYERDQQGLQR